MVDRCGRRRDAGAVTAETALALPAVVMVLVLVLGLASTAVAGLQCHDAARAGARAAARGDAAGRVGDVVRSRAPQGADVSITSADGLTSVRVSHAVPWPLPGGPATDVSAVAVADAEASLLDPTTTEGRP